MALAAQQRINNPDGTYSLQDAYGGWTTYDPTKPAGNQFIGTSDGPPGSGAAAAAQQAKNTQAAQAAGLAERNASDAAAGVRPGRTDSQADTISLRSLRDQYSTAFSNGSGNTAPTIAKTTIDAGPQGEARALQLGAAGSYQDVLSGNTPSVAALQGQQAVQQNALNQSALAAGARGPNRGLALRSAMNNIAQLNAGAGASAAIQRAGEQDTARAGLASTAGNIRTGDLNLAGTQAGLDTGVNTTNAANQVTTNGQENAYKLGAGNLSTTAGSQLLATDAGQTARADELAKEQADRTAAAIGGAFNDVTTAGTGLGVAQINADAKEKSLQSDIRVKTDVEPGNVEARRLFASLHPIAFKYDAAKVPGAPKGEHAGVVAQEVEASGPIGRSMVSSEGGVKRIDIPMATSALMASAADMEQRLKQLEAKKGKR